MVKETRVLEFLLAQPVPADLGSGKVVGMVALGGDPRHASYGEVTPVTIVATRDALSRERSAGQVLTPRSALGLTPGEFADWRADA